MVALNDVVIVVIFAAIFFVPVEINAGYVEFALEIRIVAHGFGVMGDMRRRNGLYLAEQSIFGGRRLLLPTKQAILGLHEPVLEPLEPFDVSTTGGLGRHLLRAFLVPCELVKLLLVLLAKVVDSGFFVFDAQRFGWLSAGASAGRRLVQVVERLAKVFGQFVQSGHGGCVEIGGATSLPIHVIYVDVVLENVFLARVGASLSSFKMLHLTFGI